VPGLLQDKELSVLPEPARLLALRERLTWLGGRQARVDHLRELPHRLIRQGASSVDPRNTNRECTCCGSVDRRNRPPQSGFHCVARGYVDHMDVNAAQSICSKARTVVDTLGVPDRHSTSRLSTGTDPALQGSVVGPASSRCTA